MELVQAIRLGDKMQYGSSQGQRKGVTVTLPTENVMLIERNNKEVNSKAVRLGLIPTDGGYGFNSDKYQAYYVPEKVYSQK